MSAEREYRNKYYQDHREELLAKQRIRQRLSWKEEPERHKGYHKRWMEKYPGAQIRANKKWKIARDEQQREEIKKVFDLKCQVCGKIDPRIKLGVHLHKKDGQPHNYDKVYRLKYILEHPGEFTPVCGSHHRRVHYLLKQGYSWEEVAKGLIPDELKKYLFASTSLNP